MPQRSSDHVAFGRAVRSVRLARGLSQEALAAHSGLHRTYIGGIERGERNLSYTNLLRLAASLDVSASELVRRAETGED
ncbi:MAG TPA: helix-turn-helix transcriptional regulator [Solirubrobacteraceae bacterium]|nr:helix-turn-helix transcriptional regulator [Solirubrobacteraceae bacterium]